MERKHKVLISLTTELLDSEMPVLDWQQILKAVYRVNSICKKDLTFEDKTIIVAELARRFGVK